LPLGGSNADSCSGDSGGALIYRSSPEEPWFLVGIVSYGDSRWQFHKNFTQAAVVAILLQINCKNNIS